MSTGRSPSQTIGPFFAFALPWPDGPFAAPEGAPGGAWLRGRLYDGAGAPVPDGLIETWQSGPAGVRGFARSATDADGRWAIHTIKPPPIAGPIGTSAPHLALSIFARGLLRRAVTRVYFGDEEAANRADPLLRAIVDHAARATLIAVREEGGHPAGDPLDPLRPGSVEYRLDLRLQGEGETVFFDV